MLIISNHKFKNHLKNIFIYKKLQIFLTHHVHYTPFKCGKRLLKFFLKNNQFWKVLNFLSFRIPHILKYNFFLNVVNRSLLNLFPPSNSFNYMNPFDSPLQIWFHLTQYVFIFKGPKSKFKLKILLNGFFAWILNIHMNEKNTCHGFKW